MEISEQLKNIRKKNGMTQAEFAEKLEVSTATVASVENGSREAPKGLMKSLVTKFNVDARWLLTGEGNPDTEPASPQIIPQDGEETACIPFYDIDVMAHIAESLDLKEETPAGVLSIPGFKDCIACFPVYGSSMEPKISNGDVIAVSQAVTCDQILWGEIYLVITDAWRVVKTVHPGKTEEYIILRSINPAYAGDTNLKKKDLRALYLVRGVVSRLGM
ncbi:MAG: LexA family transcriptional regulator [Treponema sp.]|nr:LexA family transcriptional regulator [Treponema sp.]